MSPPYHLHRRVAMAVASMALAIAPPSHGVTVQQQKQVELSQLRSRIEVLTQRLSQDRESKQDLETRLRDTERAMGEVAGRLRELRIRLETTATRLEKLRMEAHELRQGLSEQRSSLANQIRTAYMMGRQDYLKILLNQQDPASLGRVLAYYDYFNRARARRIQDLSTRLERLAQVEQAIGVENHNLSELQAVTRGRQADLEERRSERTALLAAVETRLKKGGNELQRLKGDERHLKELLDGLGDVFADLPVSLERRKPFAKMKKRLPWPNNGNILHGFGTSRGLGNLKWQGVVIDAREGDLVRAIYHGRVAFADWLRGQGLLIIIDHGNGYMSLYGHNEGLLKETGDWVEPGEPVALASDTGSRGQSGLYFEIRHKGAPVNPARWCRKGVTPPERTALVSP